MAKRESGFYWVRVGGNPPEWWIAQYFSIDGTWEACGLSGKFDDLDFLEVDEQQIKR